MAGTFAACLGGGPTAVDVPPLRVGDVATYRTQSDDAGIRLQISGTPTVAFPWEKTERRSLELLVTRLKHGETPTSAFHVSLQTGVPLQYANYCAFFEAGRNGSCDRAIVKHEYGPALSQVWGLGASLFAGITLKEGQEIDREFHERGETRTVTFRVSEVGKSGASVADFSRGSDGDGSRPRSEFLFDSETAFPRSAKIPVWVPATPSSPGHWDHIEYERAGFAAGATPVELPLAGAQAPDTVESLGTPEPWSDLYFPGAWATLGPLKSSFGEFLNYSLSQGLAENRRDAYSIITMAKSGEANLSVGPVPVQSSTETQLRARYFTSDTHASEYLIEKRREEGPLGLKNESVFSYERGPAHDDQRPTSVPNRALNYENAVSFVEETIGLQNYTALVKWEPQVAELEPGKARHLSYQFMYCVRPLSESSCVNGPVTIDAELGIPVELTRRV